MNDKVAPEDLFCSSLSGRAAVITGAGSGIGQAVALALAHQGMDVLLVGRREEQLRLAAQRAGHRARVLAADLTTEKGIMAVASAVPPELRVLVHCAGIHLHGPATTVSQSAWADLDAINLHAPVLLTNACLPALRAASGHVVFVNSAAGLQSGNVNAAAYAAGKHALRAMADSLRRELNSDGIRVLTVFPGRTDTPMQGTILAHEGRVAEKDTLLPPSDVAAMILASLLLSKSAQVTDITMLPTQRL
jgi:NAD(P)-dependent dehydrogenase (short-subunit alcohol dehydrogenase family)